MRRSTRITILGGYGCIQGTFMAAARRIDALRAVRHTTTNVYDRSAPSCPECSE